MNFFLLCFSFAVQFLPELHQGAGDPPQANLIPNNSFEEFSAPPIGWFYKGQHFTDVMKYWSSATAASPDAFGPRVRVPDHWAEKGFGQQQPHSGKSMIGITTYGCDEGKPHCREYVQIQLREPLVPGQTYYAEFWVSHLPRSLQINNIGMAFSNKRLDFKTDVQLNLRPLVNAAKTVEAPNGKWVKISGKFKAPEEADYLVIGNFFPDSLTAVKSSCAEAFPYAYYYLDDVLLRKEEPIIEVPIREDDLSRIPITAGQVITLRNIFFDFDKFELLPRSYTELNKLLHILQNNPAMVIEIRGHTDNTGDRDYNLYLSRKRAEAVVQYLLENGVSAARAKYRGYGDAQPIAANTTDEGRQLNRRVEFLVVKK